MVYKQRQNEKGFTLVELSIVLVIIGLIVGGVLVGQDLIKAAQVRAVVSQLQQYDAAINTFRSKYDGLPGDFTRAVAFNLGNPPANGNGDGLINAAGAPAATFSGELQQFWHQLSAANLIGGNYLATGAVLGTDYPENKLKKGGLVAFSRAGSSLNYYGLSVDADGFNYGEGLTPAEAFGIDSKLDDGAPETGIVRATNAAGTIVAPDFANVPEGAAGAAGACIATGVAPAPNEYNVSVESNLCPLEIRISG